MQGISTILFLLQIAAVNTGSHSIWGFATLIYGETQFPEFSAVIMVDDVQVLYYDSNIRKFISRAQQSSTNEEADVMPTSYTMVEGVYSSMKTEAHHIKSVSNHSNGVHVYQRLAGCVLDNDKESPGMVWDAYDGTEAMSYNMQNYTFNPLWPERMWDRGKKEAMRMFFKEICQPFCIQTLKHYLRKEKNVVLRKERPRVRLLHKTHTETGEVRVSCLATGFYPRHINLTMLRDGHPIPEEELILGDLLPNGDGTYQLRRTLSVGRGAERETPLHLLCHTPYSGQQAGHQLGTRDGPNILVIIAVVMVVLTLIFTVPAFVLHKRRLKGSKTSLRPVYTAAAETEDFSSNSSTN
ncbi:hypothetical protein AGOR_G00138950 [Albula goreensis]|uniref:Immunoglobulin C1-set domain-containing protein n=1 Tax=Albula goreensis TaxID=1534307 RepID=A0A8T3DBL2_9TELE|nr:hypothetical protein AGOR_G00138950 [Albula goreensis]